MFVLVLVGVSLLSFTLVELFGKDPAEALARRGSFNATYEQIEAIREQLGLNRPFIVRYFSWFTGLFRGDVGTSIITFRPIMTDVGQYLPVSLKLVGLSMVWVIIFTLPLSIMSARFQNRLPDHLTRILSLIGLCFPSFWLGLLLLIAFAVKIPIFNVVPQPGIKAYVLPSFALAVPVAAGFIRIFRATLLKELSSDYAVYAHARGLSLDRILVTHAFRNALPPVVTLFCQYLGYMVAGSVVIEQVFTLNGLGDYMLRCISGGDSTSLATCVIIIAAIFVIANLAGDIINRMLCPWMVKEYNV